jgi:hypothetical protein
MLVGNLSRLRALSQSLELAVAGKFLSLMKALDCQTVHVYPDGRYCMQILTPEWILEICITN